MTELLTERLHLRPFRPADFEAHAAICADPEVMRFIRAGALTRSDSWWQLARYMGHWQLRGYGLWAVVERATDRLVGHLGFLDPEGGHGFEMGWALARGRGGRATRWKARARPCVTRSRRCGRTTSPASSAPTTRARSASPSGLARASKASSRKAACASSITESRATRRRARARRRRDVPEHQDALQFRAAGDARGDPGVFAAVRAEAERLQQAFAGERGGVRSRRGPGRSGGAAPHRLSRDERRAPGPRGRGAEGPGEERGAVRSCAKRGVRGAVSVSRACRRPGRGAGRSS